MQYSRNVLAAGRNWSVGQSFKLCSQNALVWCAMLGVLALAQPSSGQGITDVIAVTGNTAPDGNGTFADFYPPVLNNTGQVAFMARLTGTSDGTADDRGVYRGAGGPLTQIAREFAFLGSREIVGIEVRINDAGQVVFLSQGLSGAVGDPVRNKIERGDGGPIATIAREGDAVPGGNGTFTAFDQTPALNNSGSVAFFAYLENSTSGTHAIYRYANGNIIEIARHGDTDPRGNEILSPLSTDPVINSTGQVAFLSFLNGAMFDTGIYRGTGGTLTQIARSGPAAPDGNGRFKTLGGKSLNASGEVAFIAVLEGTSSGTGRGIYVGSGGALTQIVRDGQPAPDGDGVFDDFGGRQLNASGQVAFRGIVVGTTDGNEDEGIFLGSGGALIQIAREGERAPDGNGEFYDFEEPLVNASGQVAFRATLSNFNGQQTAEKRIFLANGLDMIEVARGAQSLGSESIADLSFVDLNDAGQVSFLAQTLVGGEAIARFTIPDVHWTVAGSGSWTTDAHWTQGIEPNSFHDTFIDLAENFTVSAPTTNKTVKSLTLGSSGTGPGPTATLRLSGILAGDLRSLEDVFIRSRGELVLENDRTFSAPGVHNSGIIRGTGSISADIDNNLGGMIRTGPGERLILTAATHNNYGLIEAIGTEAQRAEIHVIGVMTNRVGGRIMARNALLRFHQNGAGGTVINDGDLAFSFGSADVFGSISNRGNIVVSGNSSVTFYDNVTNADRFNVSSGSTAVIFGTLSQNGIVGGGTVFLEGNVQPGASPGMMNFGGDVNFGPLSMLNIEIGGVAAGTQFDQVNVVDAVTLGGTLDVDLVNGFVPAANASFDIMTYGMRTGTFETVDLPPLPAGMAWSLDYGPTDLTLSVGSSLLPGDIDLDGDVDRVDAALFTRHLGLVSGSVWAMGDFDDDGQTSLADLRLLQANFGVAGPSPNPVPEPSFYWLIGGALLALLHSAGRRSRA